MADESDDLPGDTGDPTDAEDRELLSAWADGDNGAGDRLTMRYFDRIRAYFVRRAPDEHEDLVGATFLQLARSKANYRGEASVRVFIYSIARNVFRQHLRSLRRMPNFDPYTTSVVEAYGRRPSSMLVEQENHQILLDALQEIPSTAQDLLELRYWKELTGPELRDLFEIPEGTVRSRLHAAVKKLRGKFEELSERSRVSEEEVERWLVEARP